MRVSKRGREVRVTLNIFGLVPTWRIYSKQTLSCAARVSLDFTRHLRERAKLQQLYCKRSRNAPALCQPCQRLCREQRNKSPEYKCHLVMKLKKLENHTNRAIPRWKRRFVARFKGEKPFAPSNRRPKITQRPMAFNLILVPARVAPFDSRKDWIRSSPQALRLLWRSYER